jgi:cytochrome c oxidase subunit IV
MQFFASFACGCLAVACFICVHVSLIEIDGYLKSVMIILNKLFRAEVMVRVLMHGR